MIFRKTAFMTIVLVVLGAVAAQASVIDITGGIGADGALLEQSWLASVGALKGQDSFEELAPNAVDTGSGIQLAVGTLTGYGHIGSVGTYMEQFDEHATSGDNYWSNAAPDSGVEKGDFTLNLNAGTRSLGFYSIDFHDVGGQVTITVNTNDGSAQTFNLFSQGTILGSASPGTGVLDSGTEVYWVIKADTAITSIVFHKSDGDGYAIDGISAAETPIPATLWLLGSGGLGLVGLCRFYG